MARAPGRPHPVFCASVAHATFARAWLEARGVRVRAVHSEPGSDDRGAALDDLADGAIDAICSVDMFNEGIDVPTVDRVVMLRPTESPVVFLQQLGRGLRRPRDADKTRLTVIDFVGNHRMFLERVRRLLSLASGGERAHIGSLLEATGPVELPTGCSIDVELEAKNLLHKLLPRGGREVERIYRELRDGRDERPRAGELQRMGYLPSTLRQAGHDTWFDFVHSEGDLLEDEQRALEDARAWLRELEVTAMTKCFKMVVVEALLEADALYTGLPLTDLARRSHAILRRSPELFRDVQDRDRFSQLADDNLTDWLAYWRKNPIEAWTTEGKSKRRVFFRLEFDRLVPTLSVSEEAREPLERMTRELVDYRLAWYRARAAGRTTSPSHSFDCKLTWNRRDPILKLPSRASRPGLPEGDTDVRLPDGTAWTFRFAKELVNVARPAGATARPVAVGWDPTSMPRVFTRPRERPYRLGVVITAARSTPLPPASALAPRRTNPRLSGPDARR